MRLSSRGEAPFLSSYRLILGDLIHCVGPEIYLWPRTPRMGSIFCAYRASPPNVPPAWPPPLLGSPFSQDPHSLPSQKQGLPFSPASWKSPSPVQFYPASPPCHGWTPVFPTNCSLSSRVSLLKSNPPHMPFPC